MSENYNSIKVAGILISVSLFFLFIYIVSYSPFPHAKYISYELIPIDPPDQLGSSMSGFLWNYRGLDLIMQTLVLFATAISCIALLREEKH